MARENKTVLLCDISDTHVSIALASVSPNKKPVIVHTERVPITTSEEEITSTQKESQVAFHLRKSLSVLNKKLHINSNFFSKKTLEVNLVLCTLSVPWYKAETRFFKDSYEKPIIIDKKYLDKVLQKELRSFKNVILSEVKEDSKAEYSAIEHVPVGVFLNNYHTRKPLLKKAKDISITFYLSAAKRKFLSNIDTIVHNFIHPEKFVFSTFPYIFFKSVPKIFPETTHGILIHVAGEHTDISYMTHNDLVYTDTIDIGRNHIIRGIMKQLKVPAEVAVSYCGMIKRGQGNQSLKSEVVKATEKPIKDFIKRIKEKSDNFQNEHKNHEVDVYLVSDYEISNLLGEALKSQDSAGPFHVHIFNNDTLKNVVLYKPHTEEDFSLALMSVFSERLI